MAGSYLITLEVQVRLPKTTVETQIDKAAAYAIGLVEVDRKVLKDTEYVYPPQVKQVVISE